MKCRIRVTLQSYKIKSTNIEPFEVLFVLNVVFNLLSIPIQILSRIRSVYFLGFCFSRNEQKKEPFKVSEPNYPTLGYKRGFLINDIMSNNLFEPATS